MMADVDTVPDDVDTCRICSMPGEDEHPLFYPCKCSGTIKFIHQDCLTTWLEHSKKKKCDVCKHAYAFTNVYADDMPPQLPLPIILKQVATQFVSFSIFLGRATTVSLIWLVVVPYTTFLTWRTYFWFGNLLAWCLNSRSWPGPLSPPLGAVSWIFNITSVLSDPSESPPATRETVQVMTSTISSDIFTGQIISTLIVLVILSVFLLREWILQNAPRGVFDEEPVELADQPAAEEDLAAPQVAEEADAQHAAPDDVIVYPGDETPPLVDVPHVPPPRPLTPFPTAEDDSASDHTLDEDSASGSGRKETHPHRFDRPIAPLPRSSNTPQRQLRFLETELPKPTPSTAWTVQDAPVTPMSADSQSSSLFHAEDEETLPGADAPRSANATFSPSTEDEPSAHSIPPFTPSAFQFTIDPPPKRNGSDDSYDAISPGEVEEVEAPTTPSALATPSSNASLQYPAPQVQPESPASSSSQESVAPPALPPFTPSLFTFQSAGGPGPDTPGAEFPPAAERPFEFSFVQEVGRTSSPASSAIVSPQRPFAPVVSPGSSKRPALAPATPSEEIPIALYRAPEDIDNTDEEQRPVSSRPRKRQRGPTEAEMDEYFRRVDEDAGPGPSPSSYSVPSSTTGESQTPPPRPIPRDWSSPSESERTLSEDGEPVDDGNPFGDEQYDDDEFEWVPPEDGDDLELGQDDGAGAGLPNLVLDDGRGPFVPAGNGPVNAPPAEVEFDDGALGDANGEEDFDGVLEAVGLRGPLWAVFQNAAIAAILMDLAILIGVWFPYTIGKTLSLLTLAPRQVLSMVNWPIRIVRFISDPIADAGVWLVKDYLFPRVVSILRVLIAVLGSVIGLRVFDAPPAPLAPPSLDLPLPVALNVTIPALVNHTQLALDWLQLLPLDNSTAEYSAETFAHWFGRWSSLVESDSARSRVVAICMGYVWVLAFTAAYVSYTSPTEGREVARVIRRELRQQLIMAKVGIFLAIELLFFPIICGVLLNIVSLPLTPSISLHVRANFVWNSPLTGTFALWLLGTTFMYQFAISLGDCRSLMRDGALWFVKDPQDPASHPIRDIVERPVLSQVRKLSLSMCMYTFFVVFCVGGTILAVVGACHGLLPLRWKVREPLSEVPIDLLFIHFVVPPTLKALRLKQNGSKALKHWWEYMSYQFRLSSYMYGKRFADEEYTAKKWTWRYLVTPWKPLTEPQENMECDGNFLRVPASDHVVLPRNQKRVLIRTDEQGNPNDPAVAEPIIAAQVAEANKENRDPKMDWLIVYTPPHFRWRVIGFLFMLWATATLLVVLGTALPLRVGRSVIALVSDKEYHDLYALTAGAYIIGGAWFIGMQIERNPRPWTLARRFLLWAPKALYMVTTIGIILPILLSVTLDLYLFLPVRNWFDPEGQPVIRIVHCWATGLVMGRMALYVSRLPRRRANRQQQRDGQQQPGHDQVQEQQPGPLDAPPTPIEDDVPPLPEVQQVPDGGQQPPQEPDNFKVMRAWAKIQRHGLRDPHVVDATLDFIAPVAAVLIVAIAIPAAVFCATRWIIPVDIPPTLLTQTVYFTIFVMVFGAGFFSLISEGLAAWTQAVRDQEFLVERRLRNHDIRKK